MRCTKRENGRLRYIDSDYKLLRKKKIVTIERKYDDEFGVAKKYRRQGVATELIEFIKKYATYRRYMEVKL